MFTLEKKKDLHVALNHRTAESMADGSASPRIMMRLLQRADVWNAFKQLMEDEAFTVF